MQIYIKSQVDKFDNFEIDDLDKNSYRMIEAAYAQYQLDHPGVSHNDMIDAYNEIFDGIIDAICTEEKRREIDEYSPINSSNEYQSETTWNDRDIGVKR